jgi:hypothetical protein
MPQRTACLVLLLFVGVSCVDVPDGVRAEFAEAKPSDRSNFRRGTHGTAKPAADPAMPKLAARDAGAQPADATLDDASTTTTTSASVDGGAP